MRDSDHGDMSDGREGVDWFTTAEPVAVEVPFGSGEPWAREAVPVAPEAEPGAGDADQESQWIPTRRFVRAGEAATEEAAPPPPPLPPDARPAAVPPGGGARRRRIALGVGALAVVAVAAVAALSGGDRRAAVPEGGSGFRDTEGGAPAAASAHQAEKVKVSTRDLPLPLDRAAAQLLLVGFRGTLVDAALQQRLAARDWGGVVLDAQNFTEPGQLAGLTAAVRAAAQNAGHVTPLIAAAQAGGADSAFRGLPPIAQPGQHSPAGARRQAALAGQQLKALGVTLALAPIADLGASGGPWEGRAFGDAPASVAARTAAAVEGWRSAGIAAAPGHFPGEGAASQDPLDGVATVGLGLADLRAADLRPFAQVARRAPAIAMSDALYAAWDGVTPATLLPEAVALLRGMGFHGVVVSANLAAATLATGGSVAQAAVDALKAGCDLLHIPGDAADEQAAWRAIVHAVRTGDLPVRRVRDALRRVLALKRQFPPA